MCNCVIENNVSIHRKAIDFIKIPISYLMLRSQQNAED